MKSFIAGRLDCPVAEVAQLQLTVASGAGILWSRIGMMRDCRAAVTGR